VQNETLRRIVYRAVIVGLGEELLALALVPANMGRGVAAVGYPLFPLFLAIPVALVTLVEGRTRDSRSLAGPALSLVAAFVGIGIAHFLAGYAITFIQTRSIPEAIAHTFAQGDEIFVKNTRGLATTLVCFFLALALNLTVVGRPARARAPRAENLGAFAVTVVVGVVMTSVASDPRDNSLLHAGLIALLSLPFFYALADWIASRKPQEDEQNAR
jgi:hypothetical protein